MQIELARFKAERVQAPQRAKVAIKRRLDQQVAVVEAAQKLSAALSAHHEPTRSSVLPSSNNGRIRANRTRGLLDDLQELGAVVVLEADDCARKQPYRLRIASDGRRVLVDVRDTLVHPKVEIANARYSLSFVEGRVTDPPVIVNNRPRRLLFNLSHEVFGGQIRQTAFEMVMALEFAYLLGGQRSDEDLYDRVLALLAAH
jgi:hypothetical protein